MGKELNYYLTARVFPAIIASIPAILFYYFTIGTRINELFSFIGSATLVANVTVSVVIVFLVIQLNRFIAKELFEKKYFNDGQEIPTTRYLLHSDDFLSKQIKKTIHEKILQDFQITILSPKKEKKDLSEAKKVIIMAVARIREKLRKNKMVLRHNMEYGFMRNIIGGSVIAILLSLINIGVFKFVLPNQFAFYASIITLFVFLIPILSSKTILTRFGHYYAKVLLEQYNDS